MTWKDITFFTAREFDSPDAPGSGQVWMQLVFVAKLDALRARCGIPLVISSGYRTAAHNAKVGGVDSSAHTRGHAADIRARSSVTRFRIVSQAMQLGFRRIGIGATFVHLDDDPELPVDVMWTY